MKISYWSCVSLIFSTLLLPTSLSAEGGGMPFTTKSHSSIAAMVTDLQQTGRFEAVMNRIAARFSWDLDMVRNAFLRGTYTERVMTSNEWWYSDIRYADGSIGTRYRQFHPSEVVAVINDKIVVSAHCGNAAQVTPNLREAGWFCRNLPGYIEESMEVGLLFDGFTASLHKGLSGTVQARPFECKRQ